MATLEGRGTLYDSDGNELIGVRYHIVRSPSADSPMWTWGGSIEIDGAEAPVDYGRFILEIEDGTQGEINLKPAGSAGESTEVRAFEGVGSFAHFEPFADDPGASARFS